MRAFKEMILILGIYSDQPLTHSLNPWLPLLWCLPGPHVHCRLPHCVGTFWGLGSGFVCRVLLEGNTHNIEQRMEQGHGPLRMLAVKQPAQQFKVFTLSLLLYPDSVFSFSSCRKSPSRLEHHRIATKYPRLPWQPSLPHLHVSTRDDR